jgi:hypothetical protein
MIGVKVVSVGRSEGDGVTKNKSKVGKNVSLASCCDICVGCDVATDNAVDDSKGIGNDVEDTSTTRDGDSEEGEAVVVGSGVTLGRADIVGTGVGLGLMDGCAEIVGAALEVGASLIEGAIDGDGVALSATKPIGGSWFCKEELTSVLAKGGRDKGAMVAPKSGDT